MLEADCGMPDVQGAGGSENLDYERYLPLKLFFGGRSKTHKQLKCFAVW